MLQTITPRTEVARAQSNARRSSRPGRATVRRAAARWTGSMPVPTRAPARNGRTPRSPRSSLGCPGYILCCYRSSRTRAAVRRRTFLRTVIILPMTLLLERVRDIPGHVSLIVLREHGVSSEHAGGVQRTLCDYALPFTEQVGKNSLVSHRQSCAAVGDLEANREIVAPYQRARFDQAAEPKPPAWLDMFVGDHARRREEHDRVAHRIQHQRRRQCEHR